MIYKKRNAETWRAEKCSLPYFIMKIPFTKKNMKYLKKKVDFSVLKDKIFPIIKFIYPASLYGNLFWIDRPNEISSAYSNSSPTEIPRAMVEKFTSKFLNFL